MCLFIARMVDKNQQRGEYRLWLSRRSRTRQVGSQVTTSQSKQFPVFAGNPHVTPQRSHTQYGSTSSET
jgi:hypothetical protein